MKKLRNGRRYVVCVKNTGYRASLVLRRVYKTLHDPEAQRRRLIRVVDESGDDYMYPETLFVAVELPRSAEKALAQAPWLRAAAAGHARHTVSYFLGTFEEARALLKP